MFLDLLPEFFCTMHLSFHHQKEETHTRGHIVGRPYSRYLLLNLKFTGHKNIAVYITQSSLNYNLNLYMLLFSCQVEIKRESCCTEVLVSRDQFWRGVGWRAAAGGKTLIHAPGRVGA